MGTSTYLMKLWHGRKATSWVRQFERKHQLTTALRLRSFVATPARKLPVKVKSRAEIRLWVFTESESPLLKSPLFVRVSVAVYLPSPRPGKKRNGELL